MATARQAVRHIPQRAILMAAALTATLAIAFVVLVAAFTFIRPAVAPAANRVYSPALIQSGQEWQLQREQQGVNPLVQAGNDWEAQRRQQSVSDPLTQAGRDWETQRRQQSGGN